MRSRKPSPGGLTRREFLRRSATVAAGLPIAAGMLAACGGRSPGSEITALPLARKDHPVTWPIHEDNSPISSGLPIERGSSLKVYEWKEYLSKDVLDEFARRYRRFDVGYEVSSFENREEALARIREPGADFDVFFPTIDQIGGLVEARLLRPLSHEYMPNLGNLWPQYGPGNPFYDQGLRYTLPYTVFSTGIGWRSDLVRATDAPDALDVPYDAFWNPAYRGRIGLYDDYREVIGMALLRDGVADENAADASALDRATNHLVAMASAVDVQLTTEGAYEGLPEGTFALHQAWSGDMLSAPRLGKADALGTTPLLRYRWPRTGVVGADLIAVLTQGTHPVLAHAFLDHLLDLEVAMRNFGWNGYQPPLSRATREAFSDPSAPWSVPENLLDAILTPQEFERGRMLLPLSPAGDAQWLREWDRFRSRV